MAFNLLNIVIYFNFETNITKKTSEIYIRNFDVISFFFKYDPKNKINYSIKKILKSSKILNFLLGFYKIKNKYNNDMRDKINNYYKKDTRYNM